MTTEINCTVFDEDCTYRLPDLCRLCRVRAQFIHNLIDEGILSPAGRSPGEWQFGAVEIKRIQISIRLHNDLRINLPGTALALDLLDEIEELRRRQSHMGILNALEK